MSTPSVASPMEAIRNHFSHWRLFELAGHSGYWSGERCYWDGTQTTAMEADGAVEAEVHGEERHQVRLWTEGDTLRYSCTCSPSPGAAACKHVVAAGIRVLKPRTIAHPGYSVLQGRVAEALRREDVDALGALEQLLTVALRHREYGLSIDVLKGIQAQMTRLGRAADFPSYLEDIVTAPTPRKSVYFHGMVADCKDLGCVMEKLSRAGRVPEGGK